MRHIFSAISRIATGAALSVLAACGPNIYDEINLMPSPTLYTEAALDPFSEAATQNIQARTQLFYATDRMPVGLDDPQAYYNNERGHVLRTGVADVVLSPRVESLEEVRRITLSETRDTPYKLRVSGVRETGIMPFSVTRYMATPPSAQSMQAAGQQFAKQINAQLAASGNKDIFIYTHGYNVDFDYSTLVSKELQHFLGYQGVFISYNWAATPSRFAYFRDQETALATRRNLRLLVEFLSENTKARRIHLIGYSAGSRVMFETAYQIALQPAPKPRLGRLILISSDLDRSYFLQALEDDLLETVTDVTLYQSQTDSALALSRFVFGRQRLGEASAEDGANPVVRDSIAGLKNLHIIDVTDAEKADAGNGHWYFRSSPWTSSDIFMSLLTDRAPGARGLVRAPGEVVWRFPTDYPERLRSIVAAVDG